MKVPWTPCIKLVPSVIVRVYICACSPYLVAPALTDNFHDTNLAPCVIVRKSAVLGFGLGLGSAVGIYS